MFRFLIITTLIIVTGITANAQMYYGLKVGANFANFSGDVSGNSIKPSMHFGAVVEIPLTDAFSVQPELLYSMQGYQIKEDVSLKYHYHYLTLPVMAKYFVTNEITLDFGPQLSYLIFAQSSDGEYEYTELKDETSKFDYGLALGASYEIDDGMNINLRYTYGFANIFDTDTNLKANNSVIQLSLGYKFY